MRSLKTMVAAGAAGVLMLALGACGSSSSSSSKSSASSNGSVAAGVQTPSDEPLTGGKKGGTLNVQQSEDFEHLDPGQSYFSLDYEITDATQRSLYSYKPNTFSAATPDMAEGPAADRRRQQADHDQNPQRRPLQPAGQPRSDGRR